MATLLAVVNTSRRRILAGAVCVQDAVTPVGVQASSALGQSAVVGIAVEAIPPGAVGHLQTGGDVYVNCPSVTPATSLAASTSLMAGPNGTAAVGTTNSFGTATRAAYGSPVLVTLTLPDPASGSDPLDLTARATPTTPASGHATVYANSDGFLALVNDAGDDYLMLHGVVPDSGTGLMPPEPYLRFIAGTNVTISRADNAGAQRSEITINASSGSSGANGWVFTKPTIAGAGLAKFNDASCLGLSDTAEGVRLSNGLVGSDPGWASWRGAMMNVTWPPATGFTRYLVLRLPMLSNPNENGPMFGLGITDGTNAWANMMRYHTPTLGSPYSWWSRVEAVTALDGTGINEPSATNTWLFPTPMWEPLIFRFKWDGAYVTLDYSLDNGATWLLSGNFDPSARGWTPTKWGILTRSLNYTAGWELCLRHLDTAVPTWA